MQHSLLPWEDTAYCNFILQFILFLLFKRRVNLEMLNIEINVNEDIEEDNDFLHHIFNAIFYKHVSFINLRYKQNI